jgi:hypothetical protein
LQTPDFAGWLFAPLLQGHRDGAQTGQFLVVPGKGTPRWLLPERDPKIDSVLANWTPYRLGSRVKWAAICSAHRAGCLSALPGVGSVGMAGVEDIDWRPVGWSGTVTPVPVVYIGTPGVSRKAVVHLVNPVSGICEAIVKVPFTEAAQRAILREADVLQILADEGYTCAPRLLHVDRERAITTQTALNGKAGGRKFTDGYWAVLGSLLLAGESTAIVGHAAEWQEQLLWEVGCEADIGTMTSAMAELCDAGQVPAFWGHGDFAPWNTRQMADGRVVLLDWEDAQRGALPLQDAFHFFHMQDFLFSARPAAHSTRVERFAKGLGLLPTQCRKLEIAYLVHSYLQRRARREVQHAEYLLETLRVILPAQRRLLPWPVGLAFKPAPEPGEVAALPLSSSIRKELFSAVIAQLNAAEVAYCVLSGHENHAASSSSDVDFMFHPQDADRIAPLLAQAAKNAGAQLIQAVQHETTGCHFVLAKEDGGEIGYLDPDCATDYRTHGRLWLSAERMLERSRRCKDIEVPAVPDHFTYYLIKKVLKQSLAGFQLRRLRHLYQRNPVACRAEILRFWPLDTVHGVERALVEDDLCWFQSQMPRLLAELAASEPGESLARRLLQRFRDGVRTARRMLHPTGMSVLVCGGERNRRAAIAEGLARQLAMAFRRTATVHVPPTGVGLTKKIRLASAVFAARRRSTFVVATIGDYRSIAQGLSGRIARLLLQPDLIFVLADHEEQGFAGDVGGSVGHISRTILRWLAARTAQRFALEREVSAETPAWRRVENRPEPAGLHLVVK